MCVQLNWIFPASRQHSQDLQCTPKTCKRDRDRFSVPFPLAVCCGHYSHCYSIKYDWVTHRGFLSNDDPILPPPTHRTAQRLAFWGTRVSNLELFQEFQWTI